MNNLLTANNLLDLATLSTLEIILGIDNVIFIALLIQHLRPEHRTKVRIMGLSLALIFRVIMLFGASYVMRLTKPIFLLFNHSFSGRDILLFGGGLFLVVKGLLELIELFKQNIKLTRETEEKYDNKFWKAIIQIIFIDLVLSFDSIIVAVGMSNNMLIMVSAITIAIIIMIISSGPIGNFIEKHPSIKVIALSFIIILGLLLICNAFNLNINKGYLYFAMFFTMLVEFINIMLRKRNLR